MVYVTGDLHGVSSRFKSKEFHKLRRGDTVIVCGDFGFVWDGSKKEEKLLKWIGKRKYQILFVDGVHDNLEIIANYQTSDWGGGQVKEISGRLKYLCRGGVFTIEDQKIFAFGGGENTDAEEQHNPSSWWHLQLPTQKEVETARSNLEQVNWQIDYIVTHQCSRKTKQLLTMEDDEANVLDTFFNEVRNKATYQSWFFGNYHLDKIIPPKERAVFQKLVPLTEDSKKKKQRENWKK